MAIEKETDLDIETKNETKNEHDHAQAPVTIKNYRQAGIIFIILRWLVRLLLRAMFRIEVRGLENLPKEGGYIFAGNHLSWIDPFLMLAFAPATPRIYFIAAREDVEFPRWRRIFTEGVGGVIPVDRDKRSAFRDVSKQVSVVLHGGGVLGIYPEGDVSAIETGRVLPLKKGIGYFAAHSGAPIVPVGFSGTKELWLGKRICMNIGQPIPGRKGGKDVAEAQTQATAAGLRAAILPPPEQNPRSRKLMRKFLTELFTQEEKEHPIPD
ncbi:MAG TPA: lysophospholipid acyltransferase family protein [Chloroflexia bacterium]|nr:lysophospholipid acyltransferase family protein [Chloroflexia bacterium]